MIDVDSLPGPLIHAAEMAMSNGSLNGDSGSLTLEDQERRLVAQALKESDGNQSEAAAASASGATPCATR